MTKCSVIVLVLLEVIGYLKTVDCDRKHVIEKRSYDNQLCNPKHMQKALSSAESCLPRDTVVELPWLNISDSAQITPTHVSIKRCDGGCHQLGHACLPRTVEMVRIPVMIAKCGIDSGICDKACASIELEEHTECACSCQLRPGDCNENQDFRPDLCSCQCLDILGRQSCLDRGRSWDESSCSCGCPLHQQCAPGLVFQDASCSCSAPGLDDVQVFGEERGGEEPQSFPTLEHIIIAVLAFVIIILFFILANLAVKIRKLSARIRFHPGSPNPLTDSDLEVKQLHPGNPLYGEGSCSTPSSGFYSEIIGTERVYKRESDSLYHSAESVRLKKRVGDERDEKEASNPPMNIIENTMVGDEVYIRFDPLGPSSQSPESSISSSELQFDTIKRTQGTRDQKPVCFADTGVQYGTIRHIDGYTSLQRKPTDLSRYNSLSRCPPDHQRSAYPEKLDTHGANISSYESATHHIDEALRLLQESADNL